MWERNSLRAFFGLLVGSVLATGFASSELLYPSVDAQALLFRSCVMLALPFYINLLLLNRSLRPSLKNPLTLAVIGFLFINLLATAFGSDPVHSFWGTYARMGGTYHFIHLALAYFYVLLLAKANKRYAEIVLRLLVFVAALASVYSLFITLEASVWASHSVRPFRAESIYGNPIFFASFLILPMALALFFANRATSSLSRFQYLTAFILQLIAIFLTGTRGAIVGLAVAIIIAIALLAVKAKVSAFRAAGLALSGAFVLAVLCVIIAAPRFPGVAQLQRFTRYSDEYRINLWSIAWQGYQERPLLGWGPENYDIVFNRHFDERSFKFDTIRAFSKTVWDKPHNYPLELLTTTGPGGLLAYLAMLVLTVWAFFKSSEAGLISWADFVILVGGAIAYQVQNLFVFETPAASVAFYAYTALAAGLWTRARQAASDPPESGEERRALKVGVIFGITAVASACAVFFTDGITAATMRNISYGAIMTRIDASLAKMNFDKASQSAFAYDRSELVAQYEVFVLRLVSRHQDTKFINSALDEGIEMAEQATRQRPDDAILWLRLSEFYLLRAHLNDVSPDPRAEIAIQKAASLAPKRVEPLQYRALYDVAVRPDEAAATSERLVQVDPKNATSLWIRALVFKGQNRSDLAAQTAFDALRGGYQIWMTKDLQWVIDYFAAKEDYARLAVLYETAAQLNPNDSRLYENLARTYERLGQKDKANVAWYHWRIDDYTERGAYPQLVQLYQSALRSNANDPQIYAALAKVYAEAGDKENARAAAEKALQLNPSLKFQTKLFLQTLQ